MIGDIERIEEDGSRVRAVAHRASEEYVRSSENG